MKGPNETAQKVLVIRELGLNPPDISQGGSKDTERPDLGFKTSDTRDYSVDLTKSDDGYASQSALAPTVDEEKSKNNSKENSTQSSKDVSDSDNLLSMANLNINSKEDPIKDNLPVWLYGNYWTEYDSQHPNDISRSKKCVIGFGARFGTDGSILNAVNNPPGQVKVRGSFVQMYTDDGKFIKS